MNHREEIFGTVYERGSVIFRLGDAGDAMYVIQSGAVEVSQTQDRREVVIALLEKGDFFGEMALIDNAPRSCTVTAICRTRLLPLTRHSLLERLRHDPGVILHLMRALTCRIAETNRLLRSVIEGDETLFFSRDGQDQPDSGGISAVTERSSHEMAKPNPRAKGKNGLTDFVRIPFEGSDGMFFRRGDMVFRQGDPGDTLFIIMEGEVEIFQESEKGSITAGKLADLAVLSADPLSVPPESIKDIEVQMTILGGRIVYRRDEPSTTTLPSTDDPAYR